MVDGDVYPWSVGIRGPSCVNGFSSVGVVVPVREESAGGGLAAAEVVVRIVNVGLYQIQPSYKTAADIQDTSLLLLAA